MENKTKMGVKELYDSLMRHRGEQLTEGEVAIFNDLAEKLANNLNIYDCMVCYEPSEKGDEYIQFDIVTDNDIMLHISRYIKEDVNNLCFSLFKGKKFDRCGYLRENDTITILKSIIYE